MFPCLFFSIFPWDYRWYVLVVLTVSIKLLSVKSIVGFFFFNCTKKIVYNRNSRLFYSVECIKSIKSCVCQRHIYKSVQFLSFFIYCSSCQATRFNSYHSEVKLSKITRSHCLKMLCFAYQPWDWWLHIRWAQFCTPFHRAYLSWS